MIEKIKACKTMPELDALRPEIVKSFDMTKQPYIEQWKEAQTAFIKKKNQLKRIPLSERTW